MSLAGRVALVTGAGSGIGRASAMSLAADGAGIAALDRDRSMLDETVEAIRSAGGRAVAVEADLSRADQVLATYRAVSEEWGRLDFVVANAGINGVWAPIEQLEPEEFERTIAINLTGTFLTIKYAVPYLKRQGGAIVITSSINGTRVFSNTGATAYSCSRWSWPRPGSESTSSAPARSPPTSTRARASSTSSPSRSPSSSPRGRSP